ncbi:MAG: hypothetical protein M1268_00545 [Patescibacteria group bacterium]|nr:hypothetical protein [Patescibacteria group bacterium]
MRIIKRKNLAILKSIFTLFYFFLIFTAVVLSFLYWKIYLDKKRIVSPIPVLFSNKSMPRNEFKSGEIELKDILKKYKIEFSNIAVSTGSSYLVEFKDGSKAIISQNKPFASQVSSLQLILSRFTIEGKKLSMIDFRFDNPLIVFK